MTTYLNIKTAILALGLSLAATTAIAHDQTDCELTNEVICDDAFGGDNGLWMQCAKVVSDRCNTHVHPAGRNLGSLTMKQHEDETHMLIVKHLSRITKQK